MRLGSASCVAAVVLVLSPCAFGQNPRSTVFEKLGLELEARPFEEERPLKEALHLIQDLCAEKGVKLIIQIDYMSFKGEDNVGAGPQEDLVSLARYRKLITVDELIRDLVDQIKTRDGAIVLRNGIVVVMAKRSASTQALLRTKACARFDKVPLADVLRDLSDMSGVSILFDPRVGDKAQLPTSIELRGDISFGAALKIVAEMADLRVVQVDGGVYVTTPTTAEAIERRVRQEKEQREKDRRGL
jgi:hypothetical protein